MMTLSTDRFSTLSLEKIRRLDALKDPVFRGVIRDIQRNVLCLDEAKRHLRLVASRVRWASFEELRTYAWVQDYVARFAMDKPVRDRVNVACRLGIDPADFCQYVEERVVAFFGELANEELEERDDEFVQAHRGAVQDEVDETEATRRGMTPQEWGSYLEDLQEEGGQLTSAEVAALHEPEPAWKKPLFERR